MARGRLWRRWRWPKNNRKWRTRANPQVVPRHWGACLFPGTWWQRRESQRVQRHWGACRSMPDAQDSILADFASHAAAVFPVADAQEGFSHLAIKQDRRLAFRRWAFELMVESDGPISERGLQA